MTQTYKNQFPSYFNVPESVVRILEVAGFEDRSYGNDVAPRWEKYVLLPSSDTAEDGIKLRAWIDREQEKGRELEGKRFLFGLAGDEESELEWVTIYECEEIDDAIKFIENRVIIGLSIQLGLDLSR